jgi:AAA domain/DnaB-like helicase N terminal domain
VNTTAKSTEELPPVSAYVEESEGAETPVAPAAIDAERAVLGSLLLGADWADVADLVRIDDYSPTHRLIVAAIATLARTGETHDAVTVARQLEQHGHLLAAGGLAYLSKIARNTPNRANASAYARAVRAAAITRGLPEAHRDPEAIEQLRRALAELQALQAPPEQPRARPIDWVTWQGKAPPPREWWIQDWLSPAPTLCSGTGGIGKSLLWQTIATSLATGVEFLAATATPRRVLIWSCEDDEAEIVRRQDAICAHLGVERAALQGKLYIAPRLGCDNTLLDLVYNKPVFTPEFSRLREQVNDLGADVLVLDNIGQVYGGNENARHEVTVFVNGLQGMVHGRPFAPVLLGHVARTTGSEFAGSAAWENACRMRWYLGTALPDQPPAEDDPADPDVVYLAKRKANYTERDYRRLIRRAGVLVPESAAGPRFDAAARNDLAETIVFKGLAKLKEAGLQPTDGKNSNDYLPAQIVAKGLAEGHSRKELESAMHRLMGNGSLKRAEVGRYSNRTPRFGLVKVSP